MTREFWVNNVNLDTLDGVSIRSIFPHPLPERHVKQSKKVLADGSVITSAEFGSRTITVEADIITNTRETLDENYQTLMRYINVVEKELKFKYGTTNKKFTGTLLGTTAGEPQGGYLPITLSFVCADPYAYSLTTKTATSSAKTTASFNTSIANAGTEPVRVGAQITLTAIGANASDTITITGEDTTMTISRTFVAGEVIVITPSTLSVTVNGTEVDYGGQIPVINAGTANLGYSDTFSSRTVTLAASWVERSL